MAAQLEESRPWAGSGQPCPPTPETIPTKRRRPEMSTETMPRTALSDFLH